MTNDYPTNEELEVIENASSWKEVFSLALDAWPEYGSASTDLRPEEREMVGTGDRLYLRLATGGWSGCEDVISALEKNMWARMNWRMSARGGLHIYELPEDWADNDE